MLVSAKEMLTKAKAGGYAVGQFNINNLEWAKAILLTAQECNSPVILGVSEGAGKYMCGYTTVVGMVKGMINELGITVPVAIHLDHGSYEGAYKVIEAGFTSVMFDGSHYAIDENIEKTKEIYYEALQASSTGWHEGENSYEPFVKYYLGIMLKAYNEFESRVEHLKHRSLSKPDRIKAVIDNKVGKITKKEIMEFCPDISKVTVERTLTDLVKSGYIAKVGAGPSTGYVRI